MDNLIITMRVMARLEEDPEIVGSLMMTGSSPIGGKMYVCQEESNLADYEKVANFLEDEEIPYQVLQGMDKGPAGDTSEIKRVLTNFCMTAKGISSASWSAGIGHSISIGDDAKNLAEILEEIEEVSKSLFEENGALNRVIVFNEHRDHILKVLEYPAKIKEDVSEEGRPQRDTDITEDEVTNLIISLNQEMDVGDFIRTLEV